VSGHPPNFANGGPGVAGPSYVGINRPPHQFYDGVYNYGPPPGYNYGYPPLPVTWHSPDRSPTTSTADNFRIQIPPTPAKCRVPRKRPLPPLLRLSDRENEVSIIGTKRATDKPTPAQKPVKKPQKSRKKVEKRDVGVHASVNCNNASTEMDFAFISKEVSHILRKIELGILGNVNLCRGQKSPQNTASLD
jgi:hypothetical protein